MDWNNLSHDRDEWQALLRMVWNLDPPENAGNLTSRGPSCQGELYSSKLVPLELEFQWYVLYNVRVILN